MNKVPLLTFVLLLGAGLAFAQFNGSIGVFADPGGTSCNLPGTPGVQSYYFLHVNADEGTASQWAAPHPACLLAEHIIDVSAFPVYVGDTETGIAIGYGTCKVGTFIIVTALYNVLAPATECCRWSVGPDPSSPSGKIEAPSCHFYLTYATGGQGIVNATPDCTCSVPTEDTTWGHVKALYQE